MVRELLQLAARFELGTYEPPEVARFLARARAAVARELGVCPIAAEWSAFARARWTDPTLVLGTVCPLAVALSSQRVVPWFRARYRAAGRRSGGKRRGAPATPQQSAISERTADEAAADEALAKVLGPMLSPARRLPRGGPDDVEATRRRQLAELAAFDEGHGQSASS